MNIKWLNTHILKPSDRNLVFCYVLLIRANKKNTYRPRLLHCFKSTFTEFYLFTQTQGEGKGTSLLRIENKIKNIIPQVTLWRTWTYFRWVFHSWSVDVYLVSLMVREVSKHMTEGGKETGPQSPKAHTHAHMHTHHPSCCWRGRHHIDPLVV